MVLRAGSWLHKRDDGAARDSWQRASTIADLLAVEEGGTDRRIAPRAQLSFSAWVVGGDDEEENCFDELRALTAKSGDKRHWRWEWQAGCIPSSPTRAAGATPRS